MEKIKKYIQVVVLVIIAMLAVALTATTKEKNELEQKWKDSVQNVKSYGNQSSSSDTKNDVFKLTIEQLKVSKDSVFRELEEARKELKIKDSQLQAVQYVSSSFSKTDTISLTDTVFKEPYMSVDTLLYNEWYSVKVGLKYPSTIIVKPEYKSVKNIAISTKRETVNPPKKFFLLRWFQKKHTVLHIDIIEKNPYVQNQNCRYVEIIK